MKKKYLTLAAVATMFAACSNEEIVTQEDNLKDTPITILSAGVTELTTTRAFDGTVLVGDNASIGLYANMDATDIDTKYQANHERFDYSSGKWVFNADANYTNDATQMLYNDAFTWRVYSPYSIKEGETETYLCSKDKDTFTVPTEGDYTGGWATTDTYGTLTSVSGSQYDLLWGTASSSNATITPELNHVLTMIWVNITGLGTEIDEFPTVSSVAICGTKVTGTLNLTDATASSGVITAKEGETTQDIKAVKFEGGLGYYEALIIPQTVALQVKVTLSNNQVFVSDLTSLTYNSGYKYIINLQVGQDKVELEDITADNWGAGENKGNLETE